MDDRNRNLNKTSDLKDCPDVVKAMWNAHIYATNQASVVVDMQSKFAGKYVVEHKTQVSPCGIKSVLKHHKSDSYIDPKRFCEVEQQARPSMGAGLAKKGRKSAFQSFPDPIRFLSRF